MIPEKTEGLERLFRINADVIRAIQVLNRGAISEYRSPVMAVFV